jgi:protein TonB
MSVVLDPATYGKPDPASRLKGIAIVVALHVLIGYALVSGMARKGLNLVKKPLEAVVIQEVMIPPPPPPPPPKKVELPKETPKPQAPPLPFVPPPDVAPPTASAAPVIAATPTPPPSPAVIAPPAPPAPPSPLAAPAQVISGPKQSKIGDICPNQPEPEKSRQVSRALDDGIEGRVTVDLVVTGGVVHDITISSGPKIFHSWVKDIVSKYKCLQLSTPVSTSVVFNFRRDD